MLDTVTAHGSNDLDMNLRMNHDDVARQHFLIAFKKRVNLTMGGQIRKKFEAEISPALAKEAGHALNDLDKNDRKLAKAALEKTHEYQTWATMTYISQGMMWEIVDDVLDHDLNRLQSAYNEYKARPNKLGSLKLNPDLKLPRNISETEIHRQPGGFCFEAHADDITAGARYNGGGMMYTAGRGRRAMAGKSGGDFVFKLTRRTLSGL